MEVETVSSRKTTNGSAMVFPTLLGTTKPTESGRRTISRNLLLSAVEAKWFSDR